MDPTSQIMNPTNRSSTETKTHAVFQHLYVLLHKYNERMEPKNYVLRPKTKLVLVTT
jgi:hypothetical protein